MGPNDKEQFVSNWFDAVLKQYGEAEPRPGLENRILATMRAEHERRIPRKRSWWPALAAVTAILTIAAWVFVVKSGTRKTQPPIAKELTLPVEASRTNTNPASKPHSEQAGNQKPTHSRAPRRSLQQVHESVRQRLERFPSPEPLSEQEQILARYVQQFPHEADLTAQFQTEFARQEMLAEQSPPESEISSSSEAQNQ